MKHSLKTAAILSFFISAFAFTSCKKEIKPAAPSDEEIAGTYKVTAMVAEMGNERVDLFKTLDPCQKQSTQILNLDHSYQLVNVCDPADNESGTWSVNGSRLTINGVEGNIVSADYHTLVIAFEDFMGMAGKMTETLTRQ